MANFYVDFMVTLYNFKSSYFSIHTNISISTCKENITASHLYFMNIVLLLYYVLQSKKQKLLNKCSFYKNN